MSVLLCLWAQQLSQNVPSGTGILRGKSVMFRNTCVMCQRTYTVNKMICVCSTFCIVLFYSLRATKKHTVPHSIYFVSTFEKGKLYNAIVWHLDEKWKSIFFTVETLQSHSLSITSNLRCIRHLPCTQCRSYQVSTIKCILNIGKTIRIFI